MSVATHPPVTSHDNSLGGARAWFAEKGLSRPRKGRLLAGVFASFARRYDVNPLVARVGGHRDDPDPDAALVRRGVDPHARRRREHRLDTATGFALMHVVRRRATDDGRSRAHARDPSSRPAAYWLQATRNFSHEPTRVASEWIVSVMRPPPPTAVR